METLFKTEETKIGDGMRITCPNCRNLNGNSPRGNGISRFKKFGNLCDKCLKILKRRKRAKSRN